MAVITEEEYRVLQQQAGLKADPPEEPEGESRLMSLIRGFCLKQGLPVQCFRQSKKAKGFITPGWPD